MEKLNEVDTPHLAILKSLNEIPFPVGKNLLADFLAGDDKNKSIQKNNLYDCYNFGALNDLDKGEVFSLIEKLITNKLIDVSGSFYNKYMKILSISSKGQQELRNPTFSLDRGYQKYNDFEVSIDEDEKNFIEKHSDFLKGFNYEQKKAIVSNNKNVLCIAGAGSGKTSVLTKRIEFLNKYLEISGSDILAITFTRKARKEMQSRLNKFGVKNVNVETFNSFCEKILRENPNLVYGRSVRLAGYQDKVMAIMMALNHIGFSLEQAIDIYFSDKQKDNKNPMQLQNIFMNDCFAVLDYFKVKKKNFADFEKKAMKSEPKVKIVFQIAGFLQEHMQMQGLRTYNDQIVDCVDFFKKHPDKIPRFKHVLIDEYQDVNSQQIEVVDLLNSENLFCVGDPRQSIFGWRGSDINYIINFHEKYSGSEIINLKKNYRSNENIVDFMNKAIENMKMPNLESGFNEENGDSVKNLKMLSFADELEEMNFLISKIKNSQLPREEIFVLARTNKQLTEISKAFKEKGIAHIFKTEHQRDVEIKEGQVVLSTIHSIKGLEAEMVFVVGCNNINFPCKASDSPVSDIVDMHDYDKEDEERRLFYVAVSRAKNYLYITYSGKSYTYFISEEMKRVLEE